VTEQLLNVAQIGATVEQVCGKRMAQRVRADVVSSGTDAYVLVYHAAEGTSSFSCSLIVQKECLRFSL
jgi:hypothetical protein